MVQDFKASCRRAIKLIGANTYRPPFLWPISTWLLAYTACYLNTPTAPDTPYTPVVIVGFQLSNLLAGESQCDHCRGFIWKFFVGGGGGVRETCAKHGMVQEFGIHICL